MTTDDVLGSEVDVTLDKPPRTDVSAGAEYVVAIDDVCKRYGRNEVLKGVSLNVRASEIVCIIGPSGSGKSTLLRCINHLEPFDDGRIRVGGELIGYRDRNGRLAELSDAETSAQRAQIGMVFQDYHLFRHMTLLENLVFAPIRVKRMRRREATEIAQKLMGQMGLSEFADRYPSQLSGGQQQRGAIARALAMSPRVMLFDEPTSALDPELVGEVLDAIRSLAEKGTTMIIVTHEISFANEIAHTVVFMDGGVVVEAGEPAQVLRSPAHARTKAFLSRMQDRA